MYLADRAGQAQRCFEPRNRCFPVLRLEVLNLRGRLQTVGLSNLRRSLPVVIPRRYESRKYDTFSQLCCCTLWGFIFPSKK